MRLEIAKKVYDMARGFGGNEALRDRLINVIYENEQLEVKNSKLGKHLKRHRIS